MTEQCEHNHVERTVVGKDADDNPITAWECTNCPWRFIPAALIQQIAEDSSKQAAIFDAALDAIAGTMSAVMFDWTERVSEKYGIKGDVPVLSVDPEENAMNDGLSDGHMHAWDGNGKCGHCGASQFVGG